MTRHSNVALGVAIAWALAGCGSDEGAAHPDTQYGAQPTLPAPQEYLLPPMKIAPAGSWKAGETPTVAAGLKVQALAVGLMHPRSVYVLPNGDILVVESSAPPAPVNRRTANRGGRGTRCAPPARHRRRRDAAA